MNATMNNNEPESVELTKTFKWMQYRKMRRVAKSSDKPKKGSGIVWVIVFIAIYIAAAIEIALEGLLSWVAFAFIAVTMLWIIYFLYLSSTSIRFFLFWLFGGIFAYILAPSRFKQWIFLIVTLLEFLTILGIVFRSYMFIHFYRAVMYHAWKLKRNDSGTFKYKSTLLPRGMRGQVTYKGSLDKDHKPHGYGVWSDSDARGENLKGWWVHGVPQGPFISRITGTVNTFIAVRIGFATTTKKWNKASCGIQKARGPLSFGMAVVECSTTGKFSRHFPHVELMDDPKQCVKQEGVNDIETGQRSDRCMCLKGVLDELASTSAALPMTELIVHITDRGIDIPGLNLDNEEGLKKMTIEFVSGKTDPLRDIIPSIERDVSYRPSQGPKLSVTNWQQNSPQQSMEILVFIGGYNSTLQVSLGRFAQLISMGNFPNTIKPLVFSWPNGTVFNYHSALKQGARNNDTVNDFNQLLDHIRAAGVKDVHFMVHSMGFEVFFNALQRTKDRFCTAAESDTADDDKLTIRNFIMFNPDTPEKRFCEQNYDQIRLLCSNITLFVDQNDTALFFSERFSCKKSLGRAIKPLKRANGELLDIDIIDTTNISDNMHSLRHSNYNHNQAIAEDLRELIVFRRRARERSTKMRNVKGNIFTYLFTPTFTTIH